MRTQRVKEAPSDVIKLRGAIEYALKRADDGTVIQRGSQENVVLTKGRVFILQKLGLASQANLIDRIYLGSGTAAADATQAGIVTADASQTCNVTITDNATSSAPHMIFCASWNSDETFTHSDVIKEMALYASGTAIGRYVTATVINFGSTNTLTVSYTLSN